MLKELLVDTLYLLALINPVSKVAVLSGLPGEADTKLPAIAGRSSIVAGAVLLATMVVGDFILRSIFRVSVSSLEVAAGFVVFVIGMNALRHGVFFEQEKDARFEDIALVPLACPMIAGPATITACLTLRAHKGVVEPACAMLLAVGVNHLVMLLSRPVSKLLDRHGIMGAVIRITGLIVMTIGAQLVLTGLSGWVSSLSK